MLPKYHTIVLVHGCFWHQPRMQGRPGFRNKQGFWADKFEKQQLEVMGWHVWECELSSKEKREAQLSALAEEIKEYHRF